MTFREAFAKARAEGLKEFTWAGKRYTTELAKEAAPDASPRPKARPQEKPATAAASDDPTPKSETAAEILYASRKEEIRNYLVDSELAETARARAAYESAKAASERAKETSERIKRKNNIRINYGVSDEMSFREAFAEARRRGAGAADIFVWRGNRYTAALA